MEKKTVLVAMSGGVDSSVAAALLVEQGYDVVGATMKLFCYGEEVPDRPCCSLDSIDDARRVCQQLGVPHYVLNLESAFGRDVVDDFVAEYARGRTPIPCVRCNTFTKFRDLVRKADGIDARWVATGHYARTADGALLRGLDPAKDQSYFLWGIERGVLARLLLPVGAQTKAETRAVARALGLIVADKPESQDICFVPDGDHAAVIRARLGAAQPCDHARVVAVGDEADVLALALLGDELEPQLVRDRPRLRLRLRADREQHARQHAPVDPPQEVRLVFRRIEPPMQGTVDHARVVSRRDPSCIHRVGAAHEVAELRERVAAHARDRRAAARVLVDEILHDVVPERALEVEDVVRDAELLADAARVVHAVERAAGTVGHVIAVAEQLHRCADDVVALAHEQRRGDGRVHAATHGDQHSLTCRHLRPA